MTTAVDQRPEDAERPSVLLVDDDPIIRESLGFVLAERFDVVSVATRAEALAVLRRSGTPPSLALVDLGLPPAPHAPDEGFALVSELITVNPEARVKVAPGPATPRLVQGGWSTYLVKVHNEAGTNAELQWSSPNAEPVVHASSGRPRPRPEHAI